MWRNAAIEMKWRLMQSGPERRRYEQCAAGTNDSRHFLECGRRIRDMLEHFGTQDDVKTGVSYRNLGYVRHVIYRRVFSLRTALVAVVLHKIVGFKVAMSK